MVPFVSATKRRDDLNTSLFIEQFVDDAIHRSGFQVIYCFHTFSTA